MAALGRVFTVLRRIGRQSAVKRNISTTQRLGVILFEKDFYPGPYPRTEEERLAAAKKYGMQPEDYEPFDEELGLGTGDYPKVDPIGMDLRSDFDLYDHYAWKTNFNEPLPLKFDLVDRIDYGRDYYPMTENQIWAIFFGYIGTICLLEFIFRHFLVRHDEALPKQYPYTYADAGTYQHHSNIKRVIHYTFDPAEPAEASE